MPLDLFFNPILKATTSLGVPVGLAKAFFYAAGSSSTLQNTYADSGQISANANPLIANSSGLFGPAFLLPLSYHLIIKDTTETITYFDQDNIAGAAYNSLFDNSWILKDNSDPTKKLQFQLSGITTGTIRTKTVADTNGTLLDSLYGVMGAARFETTQGAQLTAANDLTLGTDGNIFQVAGNTQINRIASANWQNGAVITLLFTGTPTIKNGQATGGGFAVLRLAGTADLVAANGTVLTLGLITSEWQEISRKVA